MKAEDKKKLENAIKVIYPGMDTEIDMDWDIAEVSFKAGIKKVMEWIQDNSAYCEDQTSPDFGIRIDPFLWQAMLKEWGIKRGEND